MTMTPMAQETPVTLATKTGRIADVMAYVMNVQPRRPRVTAKVVADAERSKRVRQFSGGLRELGDLRGSIGFSARGTVH